MQHDLRRLDLEQAARDRMPDVEARRRYQADQAAKAVVYYVRLPGDRIKIGTTADLTGRMSGLRVDLEDVLATEPGGQPLEYLRHKQFAADRIHPRREDFRPSDALMSHIAMLVEHYRST